jgi:hypothetical protein
MEAHYQVPNADLSLFFFEQEKAFPSEKVIQPVNEGSHFLEKFKKRLESLSPQSDLSKKSQCVVSFSCGSSISLKLLISRHYSYDSAFTRDDCGSCNCLKTSCRPKSLSGFPFIAFRQLQTSETALKTLQNIKRKGCSLSQFKLKAGQAVMYELMSFVLYENEKYKCIVDFHFSRPKEVTDAKKFFIFPEVARSEFEMNPKDFLLKTIIREILYFKNILPGSSYLEKFLEQVDFSANVVNNKVPLDENLNDLILERKEKLREVKPRFELAVQEYNEPSQGISDYLNRAFMPSLTRGEGFSFYCINRSRDNEENCNRCSECGQLYPKYTKRCILHK